MRVDWQQKNKVKTSLKGLWVISNEVGVKFPKKTIKEK